MCIIENNGNSQMAIWSSSSLREKKKEITLGQSVLSQYTPVSSWSLVTPISMLLFMAPVQPGT